VHEFIYIFIYSSKFHFIKCTIKLDVVVHTCNPSTWEARQEDGEFKDSLGNIARPCFKGRKEGREGRRKEKWERKRKKKRKKHFKIRVEGILKQIGMTRK
jgi:hypothetical protein